MRNFPGVVMTVLVVCASQRGLGETWYVDGAVSSSGDGTSLDTAFRTIQEGIDAASDGDTVIVAEGTYDENIEFKGKNIVVRSSDPTNRSVVKATIMDGGGRDSVVTFSGTEAESCILSGFTIQNGRAHHGGGILGGMAPDYTHATIQNNAITGSEAAWYGGGVMYCDGTIQNNTIMGNVSGAFGGGLMDCHGTIRNNTITSNSADWRGGGLHGCFGTIENNTIANNSAAELGGGLLFCGGTIRNNTIVNNSADWEGGGLYSCHGTIQNNTVAGNSAGSSGGGLSNCDGTIINCIIWANVAPDGPQLVDCSQPAYSCIQDWTQGGEANVTGDPLFLHPDGPDNDPRTWEDNDYHLAPGSPCIGAGRNEEWMWHAVDLDGNPRIWNDTVDMGAYEYDSFPFKVVSVAESATGEPELTWNSRPADTYRIWSCSDVGIADWVEEEAVGSDGETTSWKDSDASAVRRFYRIRVE